MNKISYQIIQNLSESNTVKFNRGTLCMLKTLVSNPLSKFQCLTLNMKMCIIINTNFLSFVSMHEPLS